MNIGKYSLTENLWAFYRANQSGNFAKTSFNTIAGDSKSPIGSSYDISSVLEPKDQILSDYRNWKSQKPDVILPLSRGATPENFEYLEKRYGSRTLSLFERIEAVDTMRELGIIDESQMLDALGLGKSGSRILSSENFGLVRLGANNDAQLDEWSNYFAMSPFGWADNLSKLFELVDTRLRLDGETDIAEEIQNVLNQVTNKKAF